MRILRRKTSSFLFSLVLSVSPLMAADLTTHLFPHKDGEVSPNSGGNRDSILMIGQSGSVGWITYQTGGADLSLTSGSALTLFVDSVYSSGTLKVFALTQAVTPAEMDVQDTDLAYNGASPVVTLALSPSDQGKMIRLDLGSLLSGGSFYGLALEGASGLHVDLGSKDGHLQPLIELQYAFATPAEVAAADTAAMNAASSASAAAASATAAAGSAASGATSATSASASATAAASSATAASASATSASGSATAAAASNTTAHAWADTAALKAAITGQLILTTSATPPSGFTYTTYRMVLEKPWVYKTSDPTGRYAAAGTVYNNKLYVCGDYNGSYLTTLNVFDPSTNAWTSKASMANSTHYHALAETGGYLFAIGGYQSGTTITANIYRYDPTRNTWASKHALPAVRESHAAFSYGGKIYIMGGTSTGAASGAVATNYMYDPSTGAWTTKTAIPVARTNMPAVALGSKIYLIGGVLTDGSYSTTLYVYDPSANSWSTAASLPAGMNAHAAMVASGKIYVVTDFPSNLHYQYDPDTDTCIKLTTPNTDRYAGVYGYINGNIYIADGYSNAVGTTGTVEAYPTPTSAYYHLKN